MALRGTVSFSGVDQVLGVTYTRTHGRLPDTALLDIVPQGSIVSQYGTLVVEYDGLSIGCGNCRVREGSIQYGPSGQIIGLGIEDRRWRWRNCPIDGLYNVVLTDGTIDESTRKTPQELAVLLFAAMGESVGPASVVELPNDNIWPEVDWDAADADEELETLCELLGCRLTLGIDDLSYIRRLGTGSPLPTSDIMTYSVGSVSPSMPTDIVAQGAPILVQSKLKTSAIGLDSDGVIRLIDDLNYKPDGGWSGEYEDLMQGITNASDRALARMSVFRWFLVESQADGSLNIPGYNGDVTSIAQIFPLYNFLVEGYTSVSESVYPQPAYLEGKFIVDGDPDPRCNSEAFTRIDVTFTLDGDQGIVKASQPLIKLSGSGEGDSEDTEAADVYLVCSYSVKNVDTRQLERMRYFRTIGPPNFGTRVYREEGLQQVFVGQYDGSSLSGVLNNSSDVEQAANALLDAAQVEFAAYQVGDVEYHGLQAIQVTGVVRQIQYRIWGLESHKPGCFTRAGFNGEFDHVAGTYRERRKIRDFFGLSRESLRYGRRRRRGQR